MAYDDFEQGERVREWLRQNGVAILVGIVIGLALIFGYRQWNKHRSGEKLAAATQYQLIQQALTAGKTSEADTLTDSLMKNHADSAYAVFAATLRARRQLDSGKQDKAVQSLAWAAQHAQDKPLKALTQLRLARADLDAGKAADALKVLQAMPRDAYTGMAAELRGDAQVKMGHVEAATKAYQDALAAFDPDAPQRRIVEMKISNLSQPTPAKAATSPQPAAATPSSSEKQDA